MKTTMVFNMKTGDIHEFFNDLSPEDNLISAYFYENKMVMQISNEQKRNELKGKIIEGKRSKALFDLCVLK